MQDTNMPVCEVIVINTADSVCIYSTDPLDKDDCRPFTSRQVVIQPGEMRRFTAVEGNEGELFDHKLDWLHNFQFSNPGAPHVVIVRNGDGNRSVCDDYFLWKCGASM